MNLQNIQTEVDASFLYKVLADNEEDANIAEVFRQMSEIEHSHAVAFMEGHKIDISKMPLPSSRAKILKRIGANVFDTFAPILIGNADCLGL